MPPKWQNMLSPVYSCNTEEVAECDAASNHRYLSVHEQIGISNNIVCVFKSCVSYYTTFYIVKCHK